MKTSRTTTARFLMARTALALAAVFWAAAIPSASACSIPVFRYALEHWPPEHYRAYIYAKKSDAKKIQAEIKAVTAAKPNLDIELCDPADPKISPVAAALFQAHAASIPLPSLVMMAPHDKPKPKVNLEPGMPPEAMPPQMPDPDADKPGPFISAGPYAAGDLAAWAMSPGREKVLKQILSGDSAVFVVIERGSAKKMMSLLSGLNSYLKLAEAQTPLSQPKIEDKIGTKIPFHLKYSIAILSANDPKEARFIEMLMQVKHGKCDDGCGSSPALAELATQLPAAADYGEDDPLVFPIIGRGCAMRMLTPADITEPKILALSRYIAGPCSCEVKKDNPIADIIFSADWHTLVEPAALPPPAPVELPSFQDLPPPAKKKPAKKTGAGTGP